MYFFNDLLVISPLFSFFYHMQVTA